MLGGKEKIWKVLHVCNTLSPSRYMAGSDYCGRGGSKAGKRAKWQSAPVILSSLAPKQKSHASFDILVQGVP